MKALDEYFLMVVFILLLNRLFMFNLKRETAVNSFVKSNEGECDMQIYIYIYMLFTGCEVR